MFLDELFIRKTREELASIKVNDATLTFVGVAPELEDIPYNMAAGFILYDRDEKLYICKHKFREFVRIEQVGNPAGLVCELAYVGSGWKLVLTGKEYRGLPISAFHDARWNITQLLPEE